MVFQMSPCFNLYPIHSVLNITDLSFKTEVRSCHSAQNRTKPRAYFPYPYSVLSGFLLVFASHAHQNPSSLTTSPLALLNSPSLSDPALFVPAVSLTTWNISYLCFEVFCLLNLEGKLENGKEFVLFTPVSLVPVTGLTHSIIICWMTSLWKFCVQMTPLWHHHLLPDKAVST